MTVSRETGVLSFSSFLERFHHVLPDPRVSGTSVSGLTRSALVLFLFSLHYNRKKSCLLVFSSLSLAEEVYHLAYNLFPEQSYFFPEPEISDLDVSGFNLEGERYRSDVFNSINRGLNGLVFTTEKGLNTPVRDIRKAKYPSFQLKAGKALDRGELIDTLVDWGYEQVDKTTSPKTFSVRGGILDLFLLYSPNPVRIEWFGNEVDSLRYFNPLSQRQTGNLDLLDVLVPPGEETGNEDMISLRALSSDTMDTVTVASDENNTFSIKEGNRTIKTNCHPWRLSDGLDVSQAGDAGYLFVFNDFIKNPSVDFNLFPERAVFVNSYLNAGFVCPELNVSVCSLGEVFQRPSPGQFKWSTDSMSHLPQRALSKIDDLEWGDFLVHEEFGIGRFRGLSEITAPERVHECIKIEYADGGVVYVPVDKFDRVHHLVSHDNRKIVLSRLGTTVWERQKQRVKQSATLAVKELVSLYAERNRNRGFVYDKNDLLMETLKNSFPFEETPDQENAIDAVFSDMESKNPMDRLVCGDVGFGKTEVALRAIMKAIISGKRAMFLTPTTILTDQHYISCSSRLRPLGVRLTLLSRFKSRKEQVETLEKMVQGKIDLVIGTHRLLSNDVVFPDLGLLVVDEEHRFGVKHKEKIKQLKKRVDVLTLTATPIPRTLQQSLLGLRPVSRIDTPPKTRRPIQTFVKYFNWDLITGTVTRELARGGQVYFLHNEISSLPFLYQQLKKNFPDASIAVAHGKLKSSELEKIVLSFFAGDIDILLCTTIVESGLDVSNANTIIINDAHQFGLAQLYQIRGRVGRGHRQAACLLLIPKNTVLNSAAYRRLKAIEQHTMLGSGYDIALKDLEIRGAGNLFGYRQSGHMGAVGFEMYCKLLQETVDETLGVTETRVSPPKILYDGPTLLPKDFVPLVEDRLYLYQRLSEASVLNEVNDIQAEIRDRFGPLPEPAENLVHVSAIRVGLTGSALSYLHVKKSGLEAHFTSFDGFASPGALIASLEEAIPPHLAFFRLKPGKGEILIVEAELMKNTDSKKIVKSFVKLFSKNDSD